MTQVADDHAADAGSQRRRDGPRPHGDVPRLTARPGASTVVPGTKVVAVGASDRAVDLAGDADEQGPDRSDCDAASNATPSPSWSVMVSR